MKLFTLLLFLWPLIPIGLVAILIYVRKMRAERSSKLHKVFAWGFTWHLGDWCLWVSRDWYDGPYWHLRAGPFYCVWSLDGLPYIFQDKK